MVTFLKVSRNQRIIRTPGAKCNTTTKPETISITMRMPLRYQPVKFKCLLLTDMDWERQIRLECKRPPIPQQPQWVTDLE